MKVKLMFSAYWIDTLLISVGLIILIELILVCRRVKHGETIWSAMTKWGDRRIYKNSAAQSESEPSIEPINNQEITVEFIHTVPKTKLEDEPSPTADILMQSSPPILQAAIVQTIAVIEPPQLQPTKHTFNVDATAVMIEQMFLVKSGIIRLLWDQRRVEESAGNVSGMQAIDVLIADIESTEVQKVWVLGDAKAKLLAS
jgi:hypothetical protein